MIYAEILAGGKGLRMGNVPLPKQFLKLGRKPIVIQTVDKFLLQPKIKAIVVVVSKDWTHYTEDLLKKYFNNNELKRIYVTNGGTDRNSTLMNGIKFIEKRFGVSTNDVVVTHDAVRPFVSQRIISENIENALKYGAVDTAIPAIDTIISSDAEKNIAEIPDRKVMYQGQTPQSFNINLLKDAYSNLSEAEKSVLTDAAKIVLLAGNKKIRIVSGDQQNFKITTSFDYKMAQSFIEEGK